MANSLSRLCASCAGSAVRQITERLPEGREPGLEVTPLIPTFLVDRAPHLLGACRAHAASVLMVLETLRLEWQLAELEDAPHVAFQVLDHILVLHTQYAARQHRIPVRHQLDVAAIVTRDVLEAVGELLAGGEQLLEVAEATRHGLAARIDDLRPRQHEVNETQVAEVVRHLVDEERAFAPIDLRVGEILLAKAPQLLHAHFSEHA